MKLRAVGDDARACDGARFGESTPRVARFDQGRVAQVSWFEGFMVWTEEPGCWCWSRHQSDQLVQGRSPTFGEAHVGVLLGGACVGVHRNCPVVGASVG